MAHYDKDWEALGKSIQDVIDRAVYSHDYKKLNQTIRQVVDRAVDMGGEAVRKVADKSAQSVKTVKPKTVQPKQNLPLLYANVTGKHTAGVLQIVGGGILSWFSLMGLLALMVMEWILMDVGLFPLAWVGLAAGAGLIFSGIRSLEKVKRFRTYCKTLGQKTHCKLQTLARNVGKSEKFVRKELLRMIDEGLFLEGHLDHEETSLITSHETYRHYEQSRLQLEQRQQEAARDRLLTQSQPPQVREVLERGNAFIAEIRRCNDAIPGEEISAKIDRMELIVRRIFDRTKNHPEIVPDLKKLMDYYLPMTVKLLNAYAEMDAQPVQGETIAGSKREIEATLDTLNHAYENLLDDLFEDTAMDISSDISVLNTLLAQQGLTDDELTKMKKNQNTEPVKENEDGR